ncbi:hypothetical protein CFB81_27280 [Burkholderia sp. AU28863]|nr:hypothetical protein CFB81_27280 [Burkholderia sp. AU28863]
MVGPAVGPRPSRSCSEARWRHGSTRYASIADDSEVDLDRPIKCCDGIHSISHYPAAPAMRGRGGAAGRAGYRGNPDGCECSRDGSVHDNAAYKRPSRCIPLREPKAADTCAAVDRCGMVAGYGQVRTSRRVEGKADGIRPPLSRAHSDAATDVVEKRRKQRKENDRPVDRAHGSG